MVALEMDDLEWHVLLEVWPPSVDFSYLEGEKWFLLWEWMLEEREIWLIYVMQKYIVIRWLKHI